jgi:hypothetical protein
MILPPADALIDARHAIATDMLLLPATYAEAISARLLKAAIGGLRRCYASAATRDATPCRHYFRWLPPCCHMATELRWRDAAVALLAPLMPARGDARESLP